MSLDELNQKINRPDYTPEPLRTDLPYTPENASPDATLPHSIGQNVGDWTKASSVSPRPQPKKFVAPPDEPAVARRKRIAFIAGGVALLLVVGGIVFRMQSSTFTNEAVRVRVSGPDNIPSNENVVYKITYENRNWQKLENATLIVNYPGVFRAESGTAWDIYEARAELSLGTVKGRAKETVELRGSFQALQNQSGTFEAMLRFSPEGLSSRYDTSALLTVAVGSSPVVVDVAAPLQVANSQTMEYVIEYRNESDQALDNMRLQVDYPDGFRFDSADPRPSEGDRTWYIGTLGPGGRGSVKVNGVITGVKDDVKRFTARLGKARGDGGFLVYGQVEKAARVVASPLFITQTVNGLINGIARPGEALAHVIRFRNDGDIGLRDLILTADLDPETLDMTSLNTGSGVFNPVTRQIMWKASDLPRLNRLDPGEGGEVNFSVSVREDIETRLAGRKNIAVETMARIDSPDVPTPIGANKVIASNMSRVKLLSRVDFTLRGSYADEIMPNTGPIPPQVGQETTYTFRARLSSALNDITQSSVTFFLPGNVRYVGVPAGSVETVRWTERSGELVWEVGTLSSGASNARELVFQIGLTPDVTLVDKSPVLIKSTVFGGKDDFVGRDVRIETKDKLTDSIEDISGGNGRVIP